MKWNDADVFGDLTTPETQALLDQRFDALVGFSSKQKRGTWRLWSTSLRQMIEIKLSRHEERRKKDGDAMVFARSRTTGQVFEYPDQDLILPLCGRSRDDIEAVMFAGYDIDDGQPLETAVERLKALDYFAILYSTHSHGKLRSEDSDETVDKYRILFPLEVPFDLGSDGPAEHERRCDEWRERLINFADQKLDLVIDQSGCDVNRLFFTPRHKPGDENWYSAIFSGRALRINDMPFFPSTSLPRQWEARQMGEDRPSSFSGVRLILKDGFDLIEWHRDWGPWFLVREFFDILQWDFGYGVEARGEARILCPSDHAHSSSNDRQGCWIKDGTGATPFVIYCHHASCREMGSLDQLVELETYVALPDEYDTLSELLCDPTLYTGYDKEDGAERPDRQRYLRWDPRDAEPDASANAEEEVVQ
ncbi:MAG: hypothetical protein AAF700_08015 [Pseudomonadota bacterium]